MSSYLDSKRKRSLDIVISLMLIGFLSLLMLAVAAFIRLETRGPAIFKQRRNGRRGSKIDIFKFRSMRHAPEALFMQASRADRRVTRVGRLIRQTSIDELPQLFNVLRGDMSLVGPRPHPLVLDEQFRNEVSHYEHRFFATPGMTGLAQVSGARGETPDVASMQRRIDFDNKYIKHASFFLDTKIMLKTAYELFLSPRRGNVF